MLKEHSCLNELPEQAALSVFPGGDEQCSHAAWHRSATKELWFSSGAEVRGSQGSGTRGEEHTDPVSFPMGTASLERRKQNGTSKKILLKSHSCKI